MMIDLIDGAAVRRLARLARATPGAFRDDPAFRYSALGAGLALLAALVNVGRGVNNVPAPLPPPASLGASYAATSHAALSTTSASDLIAPSRSANNLTITRDPRGQPDRFGTMRAAQSGNALREETP